MDHNHFVYIAITCQRTAGDYSSAVSIDNTIDTWVTNNYPTASKSSSFNALNGVYTVQLKIPAATVGEVSTIWTAYNNNIESFAPFKQAPNFEWGATGILV
jgi:hypothetical protein